jgi:hypothetical protein
LYRLKARAKSRSEVCSMPASYSPRRAGISLLSLTTRSQQSLLASTRKKLDF